MSWPLGFPEPRSVAAAGVRFSVHEAGPEDGLPVLLLHGWPELAFSWAPVVRALTGAGCRLLMPDLKGFGRSDRPTDPDAYRMKTLTAELAALVSALGHEKVVVIGHDWGGAITWPLAQRHPDRLLAAGALCTPHPALAPAPPLAILKQRFGERHYIIQFQDKKLPDRAFAGNEEAFFRFALRPGPSRQLWPSLMPGILDLPARLAERSTPPEDTLAPPEAISVYARAYAASGHEAPTMLYRAIDMHWEERRAFDPQIALPALMVTADRDPFLPAEASEGMEERVPNLTRASLDAGHWVTWEAPDAVSAAITGWLRQLGLVS